MRAKLIYSFIKVLYKEERPNRTDVKSFETNTVGVYFRRSFKVDVRFEDVGHHSGYLQ
jgi:hypothetical protein